MPEYIPRGYCFSVPAPFCLGAFLPIERIEAVSRRPFLSNGCQARQKRGQHKKICYAPLGFALYFIYVF
jgi:hypothetical protein